MACGMDRSRRYRDTLNRAAQTLGGAARLAAFLDVPREQLAAWLSGEEAPPLEAFLQSLDVVADGPLGPETFGVTIKDGV